MFVLSHSKPSYKPSPDVAQVDCGIHVLIMTCQSLREITTHLDVPSSLPKTVETKLVRNFCSIHGIREILLVGEDKEEGIPEFILIQHPLEFLPGLRDTLPIVGVDDEDDTLGVLEVYTDRRTMSCSLIIIDLDTYSASTEDESCPVLRHPTR